MKRAAPIYRHWAVSGPTVTLTWTTTLVEQGYAVCWDQVNNGQCDTMWWPNGGATSRTLESLAPGTYYWPFGFVEVCALRATLSERACGRRVEGWQVRVDVSAGRFDLNGVSWGFTFPMPADHWKAEYFANRDLAGAPVVLVDEGTGFIDHSWGPGGPTGLPTDNFSARFTRTVTFAASRYRFTLTSDDGGRLWVDDQLVIDGWGDAPLVPHLVDVALSAGPHTLRYEYFEAVLGATARLTWEARTAAILASGETLGENQARTSLDGRYTLRYQGDGNLVVTREDATCAWSSQTNGTSVGVTVMQTDGNFVVYNGDGTPVWNAGTAGHDGAWLEIANDELVVVTPDGARFVIASLLALEPEAAAHAATGVLAAGALGPPRRPVSGSPAVRTLLIACLALGGLVVWRVRHRQGRRWTPCWPQAASRQPLAGWRVGDRLRRRLPATALLLTALLLVPANARAQTTTQVVEYYHTDALGSVRAVTKQVNGQWQVTRHDFMPFGEEVSPETPQVDKRLFTGKERDAETDLDYFGARYYRAGIGRFTTVDPDQASATPDDPQSWNAYAYARNNPLKYVDPDGRRWFAKDGNARWVDPNKYGSYTSPGEGWVELDPKNYDYGMNVAFVNGQLSRIGEDAEGHKMLAPWMPPEQGLEDTTFSLLSTLWLAGSAVRAGAAAITARQSAVAFTEHGAARAALREISQADVKAAIQSAKATGQVITKIGKYGTPQNIYTGTNGVTVVVEQAGRNAGKVVTVYRPGGQ